MRPVRLEMEGFGAFRDPVVVDFTDADLFALTGPTGSGKTTVIDGICFALFGCVPRYDDRRLVAPAISQGRSEARLRLDFTVGGEAYTAVRVVRRTPKGATTKEARLERTATGEVLAGNEKEVSSEAERILGLSFDHFTTCVVLPQGEFARFLHEKPEQRQDLLVKLLDLGVYERMAALARRRANDADLDSAHLARRIADLAGASPEAKAAADDRVVALGALRDEVDIRWPALTVLTERAAAARAQAAQAERWVDVLVATVVPDGTSDLGNQLKAAVEAAQRGRDGECAADQAIEEADAALALLSPRADLERVRDQHAVRAALFERRVKGERVVRDAGKATAEAADSLAEAERAAAGAAEALERTRAEHRAHAVVADLVVGDPCPVCQQVVDTLPSTATPASLDQATRASADAAAAVDRARAAHAEASTQLTTLEVKLRELDAQLAEIGELAPLEEIEAALATVTAAEAAVVERRQVAKRARAVRDEADRRVAELQRQEAEHRAAFDDARDRVAALGPPSRTWEGLAADWQALATWASAAAIEQRAVAQQASVVAAELEAERTAGVTALGERCAAAGVDIAGRPPRDAVVDALARAEALASKLADELREIEKLQAEIAELTIRRDLNASMGRLLGSTGFEKWLLDEALDLLATGASDLLLDLSAGQYSLALDEKRSGFVVVDHRNADETRPARTLSGGETFLASLSLALALSDQLSLLAARGSARLEAIFLDEGFGTLDPATLDTVAAAIEELGSRGRMVGLISHVAELAERVPVRFDVTKGPHTSTVERIDR